MTKRKGGVGTACSMIPDAGINALREKKDQAPAPTARQVVGKDLRRRRKVNFTPEYQAWLSRQRLKRRA